MLRYSPLGRGCVGGQIVITAEELGFRLRDARARRRVTQHELARRIYVSHTVVNRYEMGKHYPSLSTMYDIAKALDISIDEILKEE